MYTPLMFAKNLDVETIPDKSGWKSVLRDCIASPEETIDFLWTSDSLLKDGYVGPCERLNRALLGHRKELYRCMTGDGTIPDKRDQDEAMAQESVSMFVVDNIWGKDKEVYRFDAELELALTDCEEIKLPVRILDRLPYNCFYIEFAEDGIFKSNFDGSFVYVCPCKTGYILVLQRVKDDGRSMFGHASLIPDDPTGTFLFGKKDFIAENGLDRNKDWGEFACFILNALLYLCAENSEIRENEGTKKTYHPGQTIKHKYCEIRKWDCEFRIVKDRKTTPAKKLNNNSERNKTSDNADKDNITRNPVSPYTRRAHWHHYWTGKGRTELSLRWIAPTPCGYRDGNEPATVHVKS